VNARRGPPVHFETPNYILRSLEPGDENEAWAGWLADPKTAAMLNAAPRTWPLSELRRYIDRFDRVTRHLFGIFDKTDGRMLGIRTFEIDPVASTYRGHLLIGDAGDRGQGARIETNKVTNDWLHEDLDLQYAVGTLVATNKRMMDSLIKNGWIITGYATRKSATSADLIQLVHMSRHREVWRSRQRLAAGSNPTGPEVT
jgi:RimJ/RimL family protein N-acetyltransferase